MRFTENRTIAWCVLVLSVFVSIFLFGGIGLVREYNNATALFYDGSDPSMSVRHSIDAYLDAASDAADIMAAEAERFQVNGVLAGEISSLSAEIAESEDISARYEAFTELKTKTDQLYNVMYDTAGSEGIVDFKIAYDDFWGYEDMIKRDDYHKVARDYNRMAGGFPGKIVSRIMGKGALNTFGG